MHVGNTNFPRRCILTGRSCCLLGLIDSTAPKYTVNTAGPPAAAVSHIINRFLNQGACLGVRKLIQTCYGGRSVPSGGGGGGSTAGPPFGCYLGNTSPPFRRGVSTSLPSIIRSADGAVVFWGSCVCRGFGFFGSAVLLQGEARFLLVRGDCDTCCCFSPLVVVLSLLFYVGFRATLSVTIKSNTMELDLDPV